MVRRKPLGCQFISWASVVMLAGMLPLTTGCSALMAVALSGSNIKYVPCTKCAIEPVASAQVVEGQAGHIQRIAEQMHLPHNSEYDRVLLGFKLRRELTSQLGSNDYRLIGEIAAAGSAMTSMSDLKKQMAKRVAKEGGDVLLITDNDLAEQPYAYSTPGYATTSVYGNTVQSNYYPGRTYAGTMQYPLAKGVAMKYSPGWDALIQKLLAQNQATFMEVHKKVAAMESQETSYAALEQRMREIINALPTPTVVAASSLSSTAPTSATQPAGLGPIATAARSVVTIRAESSLGFAHK